MPQHMPDVIRLRRPSTGATRRADAAVTRPSPYANPTTVRVRTVLGLAVGDVLDCRPGSVTVTATASTGQDLTDGVTALTVS